MQIQMRVAIALDTGIEGHASLAADACTRGLATTPEVGHEVHVAFEHGDLRNPYSIGFLWNSSDKPPANACAYGTLATDQTCKQSSNSVLRPTRPL